MEANNKNMEMFTRTHQMKVLMWVHCTLRRRAILCTILEFVFPVVILLLLFIKTPEPLKEPRMIAPAPSYTMVPPFNKIGYFPSNNWTDKLMSSPYNPKISLEGQRVKLKTRYELKKYIKEMGDIDDVTPGSENVAVEFKTVYESMEDMKKKLHGYQGEGFAYTVHFRPQDLVEVASMREYEPNSAINLYYFNVVAVQTFLNRQLLAYLGVFSGTYDSWGGYTLLTMDREGWSGDDPQQAHYLFFGARMHIACIFALLAPFIGIVKRLEMFRKYRIHDQLKKHGFNVKLIYLSHILNVLPVGIIYAVAAPIIMIHVKQFPFESNPFFIFFMLILLFLSVVGVAFLSSFLLKKARCLCILSIFIYLLTMIPAIVASYTDTRPLRFAYAILPYGPFSWFACEFAAIEGLGETISLSTMFKKNSLENFTLHNGVGYPIFLAYLFGILHVIFYVYMYLYITQLKPGSFNITRKIFKFAAKKKGPSEPENVVVENQQYANTNADEQPYNDVMFDGGCTNQPGIEIDHLVKMYSLTKALNNCTFNVCQNEVTMLYGKEGAGKTTMVSVVTGSLPFESGTVRVQGIDVAANPNGVNNILTLASKKHIDNFSALETIMFYCMLKGRSISESRKYGKELLNKVNFKSSCSSCRLTRAQELRLQLACAMTGAGPNYVVVLDEPAANTTPETRKDYREALNYVKESATILLTTNKREHAYELGDRIVTIDHGVITGNTALSTLENKIVASYLLLVNTSGVRKEREVTSIIKSHVSTSRLEDASYHSQTYFLSKDEILKYPPMFLALETDKKSLTVEAMYIYWRTMEEMFAKYSSIGLGSSKETSGFDKSSRAKGFNDGEEEKSPLRPIPWKLQIYGFFRRNQLFLIRTCNLLAQIIVALLACFIFVSFYYKMPLLQLSNDLDEGLNDKLYQKTKLDLNLYKNRRQRTIVHGHVGGSLYGTKLEPQHKYFKNLKHIEFQENVTSSGEMPQEYLKYIIVAANTQNLNNLQIYYDPTVYLSAPVAVNVFYFYCTFNFATGSGYNPVIVTYAQPIGPKKRHESLPEPRCTRTLGKNWALFGTVFLTVMVWQCVTLPCMEQETGVRRLHFRNGLPLLYWVSRLVLHVAVCAPIVIIPCLIMQVAFNCGDYSQIFALGATFLMLFLAIAAYLTFLYLLSFNFQRITCLIISLLCIAVGLLSYNLFRFLAIAEWVSPPQALMRGFHYLYRLGLLNEKCNIGLEFKKDKCYLSMTAERLKKKCCDEKIHRPYSYLERRKGNPSEIYIKLLAQTLAYLMLLSIERGMLVINYLKEYLKAICVCTQKRNVEGNVRLEYEYVNQTITQKSIPDAILAKNMYKKYTRAPICTLPVKGVSFSVKKGEILGIVGLGNSRTTAFSKVLVADTMLTRGSLYSSGYHLTLPTQSKYIRTISYCPLHGELDNFLTAEENLDLFLAIGGSHQDEIDSRTTDWLETVELAQYRDVEVSEFSDNLKRRLMVAAAVSQDTPVVVLDNPTSGIVERGTKDIIMAAVYKANAEGRTIIITSNRMEEEIETLCHRALVLVDGRPAALGDPVYLKAESPSTFNIIFTLNPEITKEANKEIKRIMLVRYENEIISEKDGTLHYVILSRITHSNIFKEVEELKTRYPEMIEDYIITQLRYEDAMLLYAKKGKNKQSPETSGKTA